MFHFLELLLNSLKRSYFQRVLILRKWTKEKEQKENKQGKIYDWKEKEGRNKLNYQKNEREETGEKKQEKRKKKKKNS